MSEYDYKTSALIRDTLPDLFQTEAGHDVRVLKYPISMECTFESMSRMIDDVWSRKLVVFNPAASAEDTADFHLVVHLGMRQSEDCICFETKARRDQLNFKGLDDQYLPARYNDPNGEWEGLPAILEPELDISSAAERGAKRFPVSKTGQGLPLYSLTDRLGYFYTNIE